MTQLHIKDAARNAILTAERGIAKADVTDMRDAGMDEDDAQAVAAEVVAECKRRVARYRDAAEAR